MKKKKWIKPKKTTIETKRLDNALTSCSKDNAATPRDCDSNKS